MEAERQGGGQVGGLPHEVEVAAALIPLLSATGFVWSAKWWLALFWIVV